jgi:hypothetical protein
MVDLATRVWNHRWKIDPIVRSLIDTDFYKLLMCQSIFRNRRDTTVEFSLINRSPSSSRARPRRGPRRQWHHTGQNLNSSDRRYRRRRWLGTSHLLRRGSRRKRRWSTRRAR